MVLNFRVLYAQSALLSSSTGALLLERAELFCREMQNRGLDAVQLQLNISPNSNASSHTRQQLRCIELPLQAPCDDTALVASNVQQADSFLQVLQPALLVLNSLDASTAILVMAASALNIPVVLDLTAAPDAVAAVKTPLARLLLRQCEHVWVHSAKQRQALLAAKVPSEQLHAISVAWQDGEMRYHAASCQLLWTLLRQQQRPHLAAAPMHIPTAATIAGKQLRIAAIMDEFTRGCYEPEGQLLHLQPEQVIEQLTAFQPELFFIESAWKGVNDAWRLKVSNRAPELMAAVAWCRLHQVPIVFWNKEDPVHFSTFLPVAAAADYVFTTDVDCIPRYKFALAHDNVGLLPFAAQTQQHNPLELFDRKDAFNFAGSYYLRYPERQRDFAALIDTVKQFRPVEIYDRNHENPHPHYKFPAHYQSMILGSLPFAQIDKAYKGYRYGINMNTIKQSQTMFARRVFELLASNTVVVSNYSRGVRTMFGDLVICADDAGQLQQRLHQVCASDQDYRKFRLLGLRKVMQQHTYRHRLAYICNKVFGVDPQAQQPDVVMVAKVETTQDIAAVMDNFTQQAYQNKRLVFIGEDEIIKHISPQSGDIIALKSTNYAAWIDHIQKTNSLIGFINPQDYYGKNYITDLVDAFYYSDANAAYKKSYYAYIDNNIVLKDDKCQYRVYESFVIHRGLLKSNCMTQSLFENIVKDVCREIKEENVKVVTIDEFNYFSSGMSLDKNMVRRVVDDLNLVNYGSDLTHEIYPTAEQLPALKQKNIVDIGSAHLLTIDKSSIWNLIKTKETTDYKLYENETDVRLEATLPIGKHCYIYLDKRFSRAELNLENNSQFILDVEKCNGDVRTVFEFLDEKGKKISHAINKDPGEKHTLAIPNNCNKVRVGIRLEGPVSINIKKFVFGAVPEQPSCIIGTSDVLVLTKQYPAYDDLYRYGFLHTRVRSYLANGQKVDIFRLAPELNGTYREFENIDIANGNLELLDATLAQGCYRHVLVHMLDQNMWSVLSKHIDKVRVTVWIHGAEIQSWKRRSFEFSNMTAAEIERQKKLANNRGKFWKQLFENAHSNFHAVFVSKSFLQEVETDLNISIPRSNVSVIHNYIDTSIFKYVQKPESQRLKILSIRSFASLKYANDLTVAAIELLSKKSFFSELSFLIIGDGVLFDDTVAPIRKYPNVKIEKRFVTHFEIAEIQKEYGVFLNPTRWDSQGVSRDEAMASGLVPITTAVAAVPEFVDASCGFVVPENDVSAMVQAITQLYEQPQLFKTLSEQANQRVCRQSSFNETILKELTLI